MPTGTDVIVEARTWIGTPFVHTGREKGVGVDCCGLVICVFDTVYGLNYDNRNYSQVMPNGVMRAELLKWCTLVEGDWLAGDVILFNIMGLEQHVAFWTGDMMIHAYQSAGRVAEHVMGTRWAARTVDAFRFST